MSRGGRLFDTNYQRAHASRVYDYLLGGTDNFSVDREAAETAFEAYPGGLEAARLDARLNRAFLGRVVRHLAGEAVLRQFLDIGTGIPNRDHAHGTAHEVAPDSRVVYVDNDPVVLAHAHQLLQGRPRDRTAFLDGDLREPEEILAAAAEILDFTQPVGILLVGILHVVADADDPHGIVTSLVDAVAPGSHLAISQLTSDVRPEQMSVVSERLDKMNVDTNPPTFRSRDAITRFFQGIEQLEPGVVPVDRWRPDGAAPPGATDRETPLYGGVGRKP